LGYYVKIVYGLKGGDNLRLLTKFIVVVFTVVLLGGCSSVPTAKIKQTSALKQTSQKLVLDENSKQDGKLISFKKINVPQSFNSIQSYQMTYWSGGVKTVAYVAAPKVLGNYPLNVILHGGYFVPKKTGHITSITSNGVTTSFNSSIIQNIYQNCITLAPMYRGYDKSDGIADGIKENAFDTENAIKALTHNFNSNKNFPDVEKGHIYLTGYSMGGGVALKVASERKDIVSLVAISPFVGMNILADWDKKHNQAIYEEMKYYYGPYRPNNPKYREQSFNYKTITAPVLLIQGTNDKSVPWQTVKTLYDEMNANHQKVTFKLIEGGNHTLTNKVEIKNQLIRDFNIRYWAG
jgi:dipeptidyl aminopeptidase/acylaminoacyl peptidase